MLVRLFDPVMQFQNKGGALNTAGRLEVYLEGTDDLAQIYSDEEGHVPLSQPAILDNNGRSRGLYVESGVKYRLAVRTNHGALLFTVRNMVPVGGGGGGGQSLSASLPLKIEGGTITNNGTGITCTGNNAWAEGHNTTASGEHSHAEGSETIASGANTHAEGAATKATHPHAHAEGFHTEATATSAHAEGSGAKATTTTAHAEGQDTVASGDASHAQGRNSVASGDYSHASGYGTRATGQGSHAVGKYNDDGSALFVVGNGTDNNHRSDVFKVDSNGDTWVMIGGVLTKATNVSGGGGGSDNQFVLVRSNMTTDFTNEEYQDCVDAVTNGKAVCVQFERNSRTFQAQLTQIENETGLLVFEIDVANIHITYEVDGTNDSHTITESDYQYGIPIFDSLQTAISWNVVLHNGDIFETNGASSPTDGSGARYLVSNTGTPDGINCVQLSAGKYAILQDFDVVLPLKSALTENDSFLHYTSAANTKIDTNGTLISQTGYTLYRYSKLVPNSVLKVETNDLLVFSSSASITGKIGDVKKPGAYIVPPGATWLLVSSSSGVPVVYQMNNNCGVQFKELIFGYDRQVTQYNESASSGLDIYGALTSDANFVLTRFNNLHEGDIIRVETNDKFIFSSIASATGRVGYPRFSGTYRVGKGTPWVLVSHTTGSVCSVYIIDNSTQFEDYGIRIPYSAIPSVRLGRAGSLSFSLNSAKNATSGFDDCYPWNSMKMCNVSIDGNGIKTIKYLGESGFSYSNDVFVEVPKFYTKRVIHDGYEDLYVSNHGGDGFELEPWFIDSSGRELPVRYVARYPVSDAGISRTGGQPIINVTKTAIKYTITTAGFKLMSIEAYQALQHLFVVEIGTKNVQSVFPGVSYYKYFGPDDNKIISATGSTNTCRIAAGDVANTYFAVGDQVVIFPTADSNWSNGVLRTLTGFSATSTYIEFTFDGEPISLTNGVSRIFGCMQKNGRCDGNHETGMLNSGNEHTRPFVWRYIENLYGNLGEFCDGITYDFTETRLKINGEYLSFKSPINSNYIDSPSPGYIFKMGLDKEHPTLMLPETLTTNANSGYCDEWSTFGSGSDGDIVYGCAWDHITGNGIFCFRALTAGTNNQLYTGRAML